MKKSLPLRISRKILYFVLPVEPTIWEDTEHLGY
jgi:hypothetical protein